METTKLKNKKQKKESITMKKIDTEGFIKKVDEQVDILSFVDWDMGYAFGENEDTIRCPFCNGTKPSLKVDKKSKTFSCSICGLSGGIVLFVMLYHKISLIKALQYIAKCYFFDASFIPPHVFITQW